MGNKKRRPRRKAGLLLKATDKRSTKKAGIGNAFQINKRGFSRVWARTRASSRFISTREEEELNGPSDRD